MKNRFYLADRITEFRMAKGVTEREMSRQLGHSLGYINRITSGKGFPGWHGIVEIMQYFDVSPGVIFWDEEGMSKESELILRTRELPEKERDVLFRIINSLLSDKDAKEAKH